MQRSSKRDNITHTTPPPDGGLRPKYSKGTSKGHWVHRNFPPLSLLIAPPVLRVSRFGKLKIALLGRNSEAGCQHWQCTDRPFHSVQTLWRKPELISGLLRWMNEHCARPYRTLQILATRSIVEYVLTVKTLGSLDRRRTRAGNSWHCANLASASQPSFHRLPRPHAGFDVCFDCFFRRDWEGPLAQEAQNL